MLEIHCFFVLESSLERAVRKFLKKRMLLDLRQVSCPGFLQISISCLEWRMVLSGCHETTTN